MANKAQLFRVHGSAMRAGRRRLTIIAAGSAAIHVALFTAVALHAPRLKAPPPVTGPPQAIIPVLIMPRALPPSVETGKPAPIRLHRRPQRFRLEDLPLAPLVAPEPPPAPAQPAPPGPARVTGTPSDAPLQGNAQRALRGLVGCANPQLLTPEERAKCEERLAAGAKDAPFGGLGIDRDKASGFAARAARKQADVKYRESPPTPTVAPGKGGPGESAEDMGRRLGNDRPTLKIPF